jgi:hypothetical protein
MHVRRFTLVSSFIIAILLASVGFVRTTGAQSVDVSGLGVGTFFTDMTGEEEAPGPGDPDGFGFATVTLIESQGLVCYSLTAFGIEPATAAHIHVAPIGEPGPVVVPLDPPTEGASGGCTEADPELIAAILENPENYYVNVHNEEYPAGAIRGQLGD